MTFQESWEAITWYIDLLRHSSAEADNTHKEHRDNVARQINKVRSIARWCRMYRKKVKEEGKSA